MKAYVTQLASKYLPRALDTYPVYTAPSTKALFAAYETALRREHTCTRCLTFPTPEMDELADRII
eukprot:5940619-Prymnesium_polylepis.1